MEPEHRFRAVVSMSVCTWREPNADPTLRPGGLAGRGSRGAAITVPFTGSSQNKA